MTDSVRRLNMGSGYINPPDWTNVDILDYGGNVVADVLEGLPFDDEYFDFVLMNHVLQMFGYEEIPIVLREIWRVMKKGATLRILTPDLDKAVAAYETGNRDYFPISDDLEASLQGKFARYLMWHGETHSAFGLNSMRDMLYRNGFIISERRCKFGECDLDSRENESLIVEAIK